MTNHSSLKSSGLKATLPRLKILEIFQHSEIRHLSAEDVYRALLNEKLDIGLATVYRVLTQFEQAGLLARQHFESGKSVFELTKARITIISFASIADRWKNSMMPRLSSASKILPKAAVLHCMTIRWHCMAHAVRKIARTAKIECDFTFFSGLPCVASACSVFGIAAGSPPSLYDGDLLRPHRSPYCLRARSLGNLT